MFNCALRSSIVNFKSNGSERKSTRFHEGWTVPKIMCLQGFAESVQHCKAQNIPYMEGTISFDPGWTCSPN